jgi:hypothetical protein
MTEINISDAPAAAKIESIRNKHRSNVNYAFSIGGDRVDSSSPKSSSF